MGMTRKSNSNRLSLARNRSLYLSGSSERCCQNVVSSSLIFKLPQTSRLAHSLKHSLFHSESSKRSRIKKKGTNWRHRVTCESESHFPSFFNLLKSRTEKLSILASLNSMLLTLRVKLYLMPFRLRKLNHYYIRVLTLSISHSKEDQPQKFCEYLERFLEYLEWQENLLQTFILRWWKQGANIACELFVLQLRSSSLHRCRYPMYTSRLCSRINRNPWRNRLQYHFQIQD